MFIIRCYPIMIFIILILAKYTSAKVPDGSEHGNGGDIVICETEEGMTYKLLDYYEAEVIPPYRKLSLGEPSWNYKKKVRFALKRLGQYDSQRAEAYLEKANAFFAEESVRWVEGVVFENISDSGYIP